MGAGYNKCHKSLITFLVVRKHPFSIVEESAFRYFMSVNYLEFKNLSRYIMRRDLFSYYVKERALIQEELMKAPSRICLISDN